MTICTISCVGVRKQQKRINSNTLGFNIMVRIKDPLAFKNLGKISSLISSSFVLSFQMKTAHLRVLLNN